MNSVPDTPPNMHDPNAKATSKNISSANADPVLVAPDVDVEAGEFAGGELDDKFVSAREKK